MERKDGRKHNEIRTIVIEPNYIEQAEGSCLIKLGKTMVIATASVEEKLPMHLRGSNSGWITAEYSMLPRATEKRIIRPVNKGRLDGRSNEIQRIIGRIFRTASNLDALGPRTIWLDCDVIQADGSTRAASINGSFIAINLAINKLIGMGKISENILKCNFAAISVGILNSEVIVDLNCEEDRNASVDINLVMSEDGKIIDISGSAEKEPFTKEMLDQIIKNGFEAIKDIIKIENEILGKNI